MSHFRSFRNQSARVGELEKHKKTKQKIDDGDVCRAYLILRLKGHHGQMNEKNQIEKCAIYIFDKFHMTAFHC